jgi:hypothetical protein
MKTDDPNFQTAAALAFEVMMRRRWYAEPMGGKWRLSKEFKYRIENESWWEVCVREYDDPFTALVAADQWWKEHIEKGATP